jgi:hypothetical protein
VPADIVLEFNKVDQKFSPRDFNQNRENTAIYFNRHRENTARQLKYGKELIHYVYLDPIPKEDKFRQLQEDGILGFQELCCKIGHLSM